MTKNTVPSSLIDAFVAIVGENYALKTPETQAPYLHDWRNLYNGRTPLVLLPADVSQVADIVKIAAQYQIAIVTQGGGTGLVGGHLPNEQGGEIVVSLKRLNRILEVDPLNNTLTVEAGVLLASAQEAAHEKNRLFPLSLSSEGSCTIGGTIATNAGGVHVVRYGMMRDLVLGLEVVLPSGDIWNGLRGLRKNNAGYDLKHLFIGSEGTLGLITKAVLKLFPQPQHIATALVAVPSVEAALTFYHLAQDISGGLVRACELIPEFGLSLVLKHHPSARAPFARPTPWLVLLELAGGQGDTTLDQMMQALLEKSIETSVAAPLITDAVVAQSEAQRQALWFLRHSLSDVQKTEGGSIKHDVSVPLSSLSAFIAEASHVVQTLVPHCRPLPFGHLGDGNIHFNVSQPEGMDKAAFLELWEEMTVRVHEVVLAFKGSIAAEHGVGRLKRQALKHAVSEVELALMQRVKTAIDPLGILNPGRVLSAPSVMGAVKATTD